MKVLKDLRIEVDNVSNLPESRPGQSLFLGFKALGFIVTAVTYFLSLTKPRVSVHKFSWKHFKASDFIFPDQKITRTLGSFPKVAEWVWRHVEKSRFTVGAVAPLAVLAI